MPHRWCYYVWCYYQSSYSQQKQSRSVNVQPKITTRWSCISKATTTKSKSASTTRVRMGSSTLSTTNTEIVTCTRVWVRARKPRPPRLLKILTLDSGTRQNRIGTISSSETARSKVVTWWHQRYNRSIARTTANISRWICRPRRGEWLLIVTRPPTVSCTNNWSCKFCDSAQSVCLVQCTNNHLLPTTWQ